MFNFFKISILILGCAWYAGVITYANTAIDHFNLILSATGTIDEANDITVEAMDVNNSIIQSYTGYVFFQSDTDFGATLPAQGKAIQFKESDNGVLKISKGVSFKRIGKQFFTVTDARIDAYGETTILISDSSKTKESIKQKTEPKTTAKSPVETIQEKSTQLDETEINAANVMITRSGKYFILRWSIENNKDKKRISDYIIQYKEKGSSLEYTTYKKPVSKNMFVIIKGLSSRKEYSFKIIPVIGNTTKSTRQSSGTGVIINKSSGGLIKEDNSNKIVSATISPSVTDALRRNRDTTRMININSLSTALGGYYSDTLSYPKTNDSGCLPKELDVDYLPKGIPTDPIEKRITPGCDGSHGTYAYRAIKDNRTGLPKFVLGVKMESELWGNSNLPIERITSDTVLKPGAGNMYYIVR